MFQTTLTLLLAGALAAAPAPRVNVLTVTARDFAFDIADTVAAGRTEIRFANKGTELHHLWLIRLGQGKSAQDFFAAMEKGGPLPAWTHDVGGPNAPAPGGSSVAVVDLAPGNYVAVCVIPGRDGKPHIMKGMAKPLAVVARKAPATTAARTPDITVTLHDYGFSFSRPLTAGKHVLRVTNTAAQSHEIFIVRLAPGKTAQDAIDWVEKMDGPPPMMPLGGITNIAKGESNDIQLDLAPGQYGVYCFIPDAKDGKPHVAHGMVKQIAVR